MIHGIIYVRAVPLTPKATPVETSYLSHYYAWFPHLNPEDAWVHPDHTIAALERRMRTFALLPTHWYQADWSPEHGVRLQSDRYPWGWKDS